MPRLTKTGPGTYESADGAYRALYSSNHRVWTVQGGPAECYPLNAEQVWVRTLADARAEIARREALAA